MVVLGVDPGLTGAIAALSDDGDYDQSIDLPSADGKLIVSDITDFLADLGVVKMVVIEQVHSMPKQGVASTFKFGRAYGCIEGVLGAWQYPITWVPPQRWKRKMHVTADKHSSRARALELWPEHSGDFARLGSGRAEAALIGRWYCERNGS